MNIVKENINKNLNNFDKEFTPIKVYGKNYLKYCSIIDTDNSIKIGHNPIIAPHNYMIVLYEGIVKNWIGKFKSNTKVNVPEMYQSVLLKINGFFMFDMVIYGLTPSIYNNKLLDRTMQQCMSLDHANTQWIKEYNVDKKLFHFGSRAYNDEENIGYFLNEKKIQTILTNGEIKNEYKSIKEFLEEEIKISEKMYLKENDIKELC